MRDRRVTARVRRTADGDVRTVYSVEGVGVEDTDAVASLLESR
ncbi:hypothetical protein GCM10008995_29290 [Halobellus salinus]|uniref:Uncharacterized protein n=1 Tax=Halobellus salinus TaxID=931585 RepID=A0A830EJX9_9EURY|nr:hypothetical protein [Halobellus salinus]GGJ17627.1 hypothetical protein GCM10008995_29290 [Halobellus salinus]SMP35376.1 hypothetical protein SAMN06265347_1302 [Halobellus salinus]